MKLHLIGPLPPPLGGATMTFDLFRDEVVAHPDRYGLDRVTLSNISPSFIKSDHVLPVAAVPAVVGRWVRAVTPAWRADAVVCFVSERWFLSLAPALLLLRAARKRIVIRFFGNSLVRWLESLPGALRAATIWALTRMDAVLLESTTLIEDARGLGVVNASQNRNFRPTQGPEFAEWPRRAPSGCRLVFRGLVCRRKGIFELLDAIASMPDADVTCDLWGPIMPGEEQEVLAAIDRTPRCTYCGPTTESPQSLLPRYDVFVLPSFHPGEGHSGAVIEAMAVGLPAIVTNHQGLPELVEDGRNGRVVAVRSRESLARAIRELAGDAELRRRMGAEGRRLAADYDVALNAERILESVRVGGWANGRAQLVRSDS